MAAGSEEEGLLVDLAEGWICSRGSMDSGRVSWLQFGIPSSTLALMPVHHGRGEESTGCTQDSTPSCFPAHRSGLPSPALSRNMGSSRTSFKWLKLSKSSAGSKLSKHSGHLAQEVLFRLFIAVGANRVQSWRQTFPKLGAIWIREGEREFSQARFQHTLTPSLRYVLLSMTR